MSLSRKLVFSPATSVALRCISTTVPKQKSTEISKKNACPNRLRGKVALVTGSTEGIGQAIAERFCQEGATVIINSRKPNNVSNMVDKFTEQGYLAAGIAADVGVEEQRDALVEQLIKDYGGADIFVSNVGINAAFGSLLKCPQKLWQKTLDINLRSSFIMSQKLIPHMMKKETPCSVLYMSSYTAYEPQKLATAYSITKTGVLSLTKAMALDCSKSNVRVNCLAPGLVATKLTTAPKVRKTDSDLPPSKAELMNIQIMKAVRKEIDAFIPRIPMGRLALPREVASAAAFLCSTDASYISGETVVVGGGLNPRI